jgi:hypothetical protein
MIVRKKTVPVEGSETPITIGGLSFEQVEAYLSVRPEDPRATAAQNAQLVADSINNARNGEAGEPWTGARVLKEWDWALVRDTVFPEVLRFNKLLRETPEGKPGEKQPEGESPATPPK